VIQYRTFRNTDPPALARLWNTCFTQRGAIAFRGTTLLEYFLFAKPYFDPASLILACSGEEPVGFALSGFGPSADGASLDPTVGVICVIGVQPSSRRQGIGTELLHRSEAYLQQGGAQRIYAGPMTPLNPYTFALYGGSNSPGFLDSDALARPFFEKHGYQLDRTCLVLQRPLDAPVVGNDGRFPALRQRIEILGGPYQETTWWQECVLGPIEMHDYRLRERTTQELVARANLWEMETFSMRWNEHAIGFVDLEVDPDYRRQGLAKFLLTQLLRHLQDQFFSMAEVQVPSDNTPALQLVLGLGFQQIDAGRQFRKE
jgi:ribosomal protein S18 acetylase RimI-like enzyme